MKNTFYILSIQPKTLGVQNKEQIEHVLQMGSSKNKTNPTLSQICQAQRSIWKPLLSDVNVTAWNEPNRKHFNLKKGFLS